MSHDRKAPRALFKARIKLSHDKLGEIIAETKDVSDTGVYVLIEKLDLMMGEVVKAQVLDTPIPAQELTMRVVRFGEDGMGLQFCQES